VAELAAVFGDNSSQSGEVTRGVVCVCIQTLRRYGTFGTTKASRRRTRMYNSASDWDALLHITDSVSLCRLLL